MRYSVLEQITQYFPKERELGEGGFATIYYGSRYLHDATQLSKLAQEDQGISSWPPQVAVKVDTRKYAEKSEWMKKADQEELAFCASFTHPYLCRLYGFSTNGPSRCLVFDYCAGGSVKARLQGTEMDKTAKQPFPPLTVSHRLQIVAQLASALNYLHAGQAYHRDVKVRLPTLEKYHQIDGTKN